MKKKPKPAEQRSPETPIKNSGFQINYWLIDAVILLLIAVFFFSFFEPKYMFSNTITTGGDTGSHYYTAVYLKDALLSHGKIMGWLQGNYAGFPLFYHYFPLPFIVMVILSYLASMQVAFKLVTVLGVFLLPLCVYLAFRLLKYQFPIPVLGAVMTLPFLFNEANSMWGANIPSTLAGEFSYGIGISLLFLFFGTLYSGIMEKNKILFNAFMVFLLAMCHGYAIILAGVIGSYFLFTRDKFWENFQYLFYVYGLGFLLVAFWLIPFFGNLPWVTEYVDRWAIASIWEVIPRILVPGLALSAVALFLNLFDRRTWYFAYTIVFVLLLYLAGPKIGMLDIRFIPVLQIFMAILGATIPLIFLKNMKSKSILPVIILFMVVLWVMFNVTFIKSWIAWNYEGFDGKKSWPLYKQINDYLSQGGGGRVVYEHSPLTNMFGTERAYESLPFFAKRNTLEGLYMQSSISSPFVFYIQSEVSKVSSQPFPQYKYSSLNTPAAIPRLKLFNVTQYIVRSPEAKKFAAAIPEFKHEKSFGDYDIYRLTTNDGHYVVPLTNQPVLFLTNNWKQDFFDWFKHSELLDIPLVYLKDPDQFDLDRFKLRGSDLANLPRVPINTQKASVTERIGNEEILFNTNMIGYPHMIKISYHPNWQVEGADRVYLVSPSFMLVYPKQNQVRLYFGKTGFNYLGEGLSYAGLLLFLFGLTRVYLLKRR
jgi:hypothetical protein